MKINPADLITFQQIQQHKATCDALNSHTMLALVDEAYEYQPIIVSIFIAYKDDVNDPELAEMIKTLLLIWLCYRDRGYRNCFNPSLIQLRADQRIVRKKVFAVSIPA